MVCEHEDVTVLRNQGLHTDKVRGGKKERERQKTSILIDVATATDRNVIQKEAKKKLKYKHLCTKIQQM